MVVYIGSRSPLPLIVWQQDNPAFNVTELTKHEQAVLHHLALPYVRNAGSHTSCGCGFNEGREHPQVYADPDAERADAIVSSSRLARYVREHSVEQIYSCWSGDESDQMESVRHISPDDLTSPEFFFRERELLVVDL